MQPSRRNAVPGPLTQDVWLALVEELRRGHGERADVRWLISVARSRFIDDARRERRALSKVALLPRSAETDGAPTGDEVLAGLGALPAPVPGCAGAALCG